ncbi:M24 family metallopeptidase [Ruminococcaceae bacterium OttesenSCG-928-L11]|nr:M24 family metallopeptidase [Ruminococcaceae bacterium OttesenSCG-928-L11]
MLVTADGTTVFGGCPRQAAARGVAHYPADGGTLAYAIAEAISKQALRTVEWEREQMTITLHRELERACGCMAPADGRLDGRIRGLRLHKSPEELDWLQQAQDITDKVFAACVDRVRVGMTDRDIQLLVGVLFHEMGSDTLSFDHVMGVGVDTSQPHVRPSGRVVEQGDFVMLDVGASVNGWGSDMTRMIAVGEPDAEKREVYAVVQAAQAAGIAAAKVGTPCSQVDKAARDVIEQAGYGRYFTHGLGHSIGEGPRFAPGDDTVLAPGMVMTVEPGIYLPGKFGVRIEDMVWLHETDTVNMTHSPHALIVIPA